MIKKWLDDNEYNNCNICKANFSLFFRKHHCRKCGYIYCKNCINYYLENTNKILICNTCINLNKCIEIEETEYLNLKLELQHTKNLLENLKIKTILE